MTIAPRSATRGGGHSKPDRAPALAFAGGRDGGLGLAFKAMAAALGAATGATSGPAVVSVIASAGVALAAATTPATAATTVHRCDVDGRVLYADVPCAAGRTTALWLPDSDVPAADREAAARRAAADRRALAEIDRAQANERADDRRAAAAAARRHSDRDRQVRGCAKLSMAARRAHDDYDVAGPAAQPKARLRMQRADDDYAALCKPKR